jgi:hypothetical protein
MVAYFRSTHPNRFLGLLLLLLCLYVPLWIFWPPLTLMEIKGLLLGRKVAEGFSMYREIIDYTPPLSAGLYGLCFWMFGNNTILRHLAAFVILFACSIFFGYLLINRRAFPENTFLPVFVFSMLTYISFDITLFTGDIPAFALLLVALKLLTDEVEFRIHRDETILRMGICLGLSSLFVFSYIVFFIGFTVLLLLFTRLSVRRFLLLAYGFALPHLVLIGYYYLTDSLQVLVDRFYLAGFHLSSGGMSTGDVLWLGGVPLIFLFGSFIVLNRLSRLTQYQTQLMQIMIIWLALGVIHFAVSERRCMQALLPLIPAVSYLLTHHFLLIRKKFSGYHAWVFVAGIVATNHLALNGVLPVSYTPLFVQAAPEKWEGKRILDLSWNTTTYLDNTLAPPLIDPVLTRDLLSRPDTYESVLSVDHLFRADPPDIIVDPERLMQPFMERIPALGDQYVALEGEVWKRISN